MKKKFYTPNFLLLIILTFFTFYYSNAQSNISTGYFNGSIFSTFSSTTAGSLNGNNFTVTYDAGSSASASSFTPGQLPPNTGYPSTLPDQISLLYNTAGRTTSINFTSNLQPYSSLLLQDVDQNENVTVRLYDVSNNLLNITGNARVMRISTASAPIIVGTNTIQIGTLTTNLPEQLIQIQALSSNIRRIDITQNTGATAGSYEFYFALEGNDFGDAPSAYGIAQHHSIASLYFGALAPDNEASSFFSSFATGDNAISGSNVINDEDGVASIPPIVNSGATTQVLPNYTISATITNNTGLAANVVAWIDWNNNNTFDIGEGVAATPVSSGTNNGTVSFTWPTPTLQGSAGRTGTFLRIRTSTDLLTVSTPTGAVSDGEVEDYYLPFNTVLPLSLTEFRLIPVKEGTQLFWATQNEGNLTQFDIEFSSDGASFTKAGSIAAINSNSGANYKWLHRHNYSGILYYRIRINETDNRFIYSPVKTVTFPKNTVSIIPNPVSNYIYITLPVAEKDKIAIEIYSSDGKLVLANTAFWNNNPLKIDVQKLQKGIYTVKLFDKGSVIDSKSIIKL